MHTRCCSSRRQCLSQQACQQVTAATGFIRREPAPCSLLAGARQLLGEHEATSGSIGFAEGALGFGC